MNTSNATKEWSCSCGFCGAKLFKQPGEMDYSFFLGRVNESIDFYMSLGHNVDTCSKVGA